MRCDPSQSKYPEEVVDALAEQLQEANCNAVDDEWYCPWDTAPCEVKNAQRAAARLALDLGACPRGWTRSTLDGFQKVPTPTTPDPVARLREEAVRQIEGLGEWSEKAPHYALLAYIDAVAAKGAVGK